MRTVHVRIGLKKFHYDGSIERAPSVTLFIRSHGASLCASLHAAPAATLRARLRAGAAAAPAAAAAALQLWEAEGLDR